MCCRQQALPWTACTNKIENWADKIDGWSPTSAGCWTEHLSRPSPAKPSALSPKVLQTIETMSCPLPAKTNLQQKLEDIVRGWHGARGLLSKRANGLTARDCLGSRAEVNQSLVSRSWRQAVKKHSCCLKALRVSSGHAHGNCGLVDAVLQPGKDLNIRHLRQNTAEAQLRAASITPCLHLPQHSESFHCLCKITRYTLTRFLNSLRMEWPCRCCSGHQINHRCKPLQRSSALLCPPRTTASRPRSTQCRRPQATQHSPKRRHTSCQVPGVRCVFRQARFESRNRLACLAA